MLRTTKYGNKINSKIHYIVRNRRLFTTTCSGFLKENNPILRILFTGGPCGGKTAGLNHVHSVFMEKGFQVYIIPEAATLLMNSGSFFPEYWHGQLEWHFQLLNTQKHLENTFIELAKLNQRPTMIFIDRGMMDPKAYSDHEMWGQLLKRINLTEQQILNRYDAVLHLTSTSVDKPEFFSNQTNKNRFETVKEALDADRRIKNCYKNHKKHYIIQNGQEFFRKLDETVKLTNQYVGEYFLKCLEKELEHINDQTLESKKSCTATKQQQIEMILKQRKINLPSSQIDSLLFLLEKKSFKTDFELKNYLHNFWLGTMNQRDTDHGLRSSSTI